MKYIVIWKQDYDMFWINDIITEDKLDDYKKYFFKKHLSQYGDISNISDKPYILDDIEDRRNSNIGSVYYREKFTEEDEVNFFTKQGHKHLMNENFTTEQRKKYINDASLITSFNYVVFDDINDFKNKLLMD